MRVSVHGPSIRTDLGAVFVSLELSRSDWLIHVALAGDGPKDVEACGAGWRYCRPF
jgi:hypothetical protein